MKRLIQRALGTLGVKLISEKTALRQEQELSHLRSRVAKLSEQLKEAKAARKDARIELKESEAKRIALKTKREELQEIVNRVSKENRQMKRLSLAKDEQIARRTEFLEIALRRSLKPELDHLFEQTRIHDELAA